MIRAFAFTTGGLLAVTACSRTTRTVILEPNPDVRGGPSTAATLGLPPGQLPQIGECRVWISGAPPRQQPRPRARPCGGIRAFSPPRSWIVVRPPEDRKLGYVREVDPNHAGLA